MASEAVHAISRYIGFGSTWQPLTKSDATLGIAVAHARAGNEYRRLLASQGVAGEAAETAIEATAHFALAAGLALPPNLQYIIDPGADVALDNAFVAGLRFVWSKGW